MSITKHCWPTPWLEAAMNAGFATYRGEDGWEFLTDQMRDMLATFGGALVAAEREACALIANDMDYSPDGAIAKQIRMRSNV